MGSMTHLSPDHISPLRDHGPVRISRRPVYNADSASARSRSATSSMNEKSGNQSGELLEHRDSSSQTTTVTPEIVKKPPEDGHDERVQTEAAHPNARIDSDPSSTDSRAAAVNSWSERDAEVPKSNLTVLDVAALILNKMIGTGILTTPGSILASTKSRSLAVALWFVGGIWTCLFLLVYLEFGSALPFNGGELIYLDEIYRKPELLSTILFSGFFLCLANSYGNSIQFAKHVLISADPTADQSSDLDPRLLRFIAVSVVTMVCLIHYFSSKAGLFLNKAIAWYKTILLFVIAIAGMVFAKKNGSPWHEQIPGEPKAWDRMGAMVIIFYAYQGWENANYVAGEIRTLEGRTPKRTLTMGAFIGVITVWILYVLVTISLYRVLDYATLTGPNYDLAAALKFGPKVFGNPLGLKVCMSIAAFGNILAVTYTNAKVKQTIVIQRILPFWKYFQRDHDTPKGALVLHWVSTVIFISAAPTTSDGYTFAIGLFTFGHVFFSMFVALGLFGLQSRMKERTNPYQLFIFRAKWVRYTLPVIFAVGNALILVVSAIEHKPGQIPRYWRLLIFIFILTGSSIYWFGMRLTQVRVTVKGKEKTIGQMIGFEVIVYNKDDPGAPVQIQDSIAEALATKIDGSKRRVHVKLSGRLEKVAGGITKVKDLLAKWLF